MSDAVALARTRAHDHCEALVLVRDVFTRCGERNPEVHHRLLRARGGDVLDSVGETYHLIGLCNRHHTWVHLHPEAAERSGLYLLGQVWLDTGRVVYSGPDPYLSERYGVR